MTVMFDVVGVNYVNKGAHLMLCAIQQRIARCPYPAAVTLNLKSARHARRRGEPMPASLWLEGSRPGVADAVVRRIGDSLPRWLKRRYRWVADKDVHVILDASGFLYSDQWGIKGMSRRRAASEAWRARGKKLIFMPQAFGPFNRPDTKACMRDLIGLADLIYARDAQSYEHLRELAPGTANLRTAPDFTNLVEPVLQPAFEQYRGAVAIVPNQRMLDKQAGAEANAYTDFLVSGARKLGDAGKRVFLLLHESGDRALAEAVRARVGRDLDIVFLDDPVELKGVIGLCDFIISSRFHAIVSALSQGIPAIGTSWSHKYQRLYEDYGASELFVPTLTGAPDVFDAMLATLCDGVARKRMGQELTAMAEQQKARTRKMWEEIFTVCRP
jgi:polysaccharide pyruvyl transferase WcaK-like protein